MSERTVDFPATRHQIHQGAQLDSAYVVMNALATIVAGYGLLANSAAVVIGAMIIASLLGPIMGIALAMVDGDTSLLRRAAIAEIAGVLLVLAIGYLIGRIHSSLPITSELLVRTKPNFLDLSVALAGGAAGAYATASKKVSVGIVGVAISTALVPPLTTVGICLSRGLPELAGGAFILFLTNLVAIQCASSVVLYIFGFHLVTHRDPNDKGYYRRLVVDIALLLALAVFLVGQLRQTVAANKYHESVKSALDQGLSSIAGTYLAETRFRRLGNKQIIVAVVRTPNSITPDQTARLESILPKNDGLANELHIRSMLTKETTSSGYLHEIEPSAPPIDEPQLDTKAPPESPDEGELLPQTN